MGFDFTFHGAQLTALGHRAVWWASQRTLVVSDLHLGKSERHARRGGAALPPYEGRDTLERLRALTDRLDPSTVICLGDSFDDDRAAGALITEERELLAALPKGRRWVWIEGNHDPSPPAFGGEALSKLTLGPLTFRHIATDQSGEVSGHYHPKVVVRHQSRPAFLVDRDRLILPAFGTYTGGLRATDPVLQDLMRPDAIAILCGPRALPCPMPRIKPHARR
ncbi:metallophosphoesterase, DNA ligase-associated [Tritonibacter multivorans]|uniref:Metallophosphoesterase, DNA ligase-associated n=2 Tax=Tritonibacter multivorans TaxID=928856 RepID=A0A0N7LYQ9_9RHOB|nr:metallophosphoesterase, DNA ligase-associated [Tritonibacter multivorans]SFC65414.1 putative phosphoesterase [Tritonibacter multivorans]